MKTRHARWWMLMFAVAAIALFAAGCGGTTPTDTDTDTDTDEITEEEQEVREAIAAGLPDLERFELVRVEDGELLEELRGEMDAGSGDRDPVYIDLPILREGGRVEIKTWTAYHVDVRNVHPDFTEEGFVIETESLDAADPPDLTAPSATFQGVPVDFTIEEIEAQFEAGGELDEAVYQPSVLNLIGDSIEASYYGGPDQSTAYVIEGLETLLVPHVGIDEASRLAALVPENYLIYRHDDFQPPVEHGEEPDPFEEPAALHAQEEDGAAIAPQEHADVNTLHSVMVGDSTVYDPDTSSWLVSNWFARVDAAANRQNAFMLLASLELDMDSGSSLAVDNNRVFLKTYVGGYLVLTPFGKTQLDFPSSKCSRGTSFILEVRELSRNSTSNPNEYWMWWTTNYSGGCAYISQLGDTPRNGAVGWSGYGNATVDWTSYVFMHESGHIIGGTHTTDAPGSPETYDSHRCELFGFWEFGPTGPSLMSYASGDRTYCLAQSPVPFDTSTDDKKNLTKVAEYLHTNVTP